MHHVDPCHAKVYERPLHAPLASIYFSKGGHKISRVGPRFCSSSSPTLKAGKIIDTHQAGTKSVKILSSYVTDSISIFRSCPRCCPTGILTQTKLLAFYQKIYLVLLLKIQAKVRSLFRISALVCATGLSRDCGCAKHKWFFPRYSSMQSHSNRLRISLKNIAKNISKERSS